MKKLFTTLRLAAVIAAGIHAAPMGTGFTYQGHLNDGGVPANGNYDMIFNLYDDPTNGNVLGSFSIFGAVPVTNGLFTVELNSYSEFGTNAFNGEARWLQIGVRKNSNNALNPWNNLSPRQALNCTPQAMYAESAGNAANVADGAITAAKLASGAVQPNNLAPGVLAWTNITGVPAGFADGLDDGVFYGAGEGLNLSWLFEFSVDFAGSGSATSAARSDHDHFGAGWSGNVPFGLGLSVTNGANNSVGLYGQQGTGSGVPYIFGNTAGVWGESSQGSGVWGASATYAGVRGISLGTNGYGVYGATLATNGVNSGIYGQSASVSGTGVRGLATATTGANAGVSGESASISGVGVRGVATASVGVTAGVQGETTSAQGVGVSGKATSATGLNFGVGGESASSSGQGVHGLATATYGVTAGVSGQANSTDGVGVRGLATAASGTTYGVRGESYSTEGFGVMARNDFGVALKATGTGIIQSDADSYVWIPGSLGIGLFGDGGLARYYPPTLGVNIGAYGGYTYNIIHFPLALPAVAYGQNTVVKSIEVVYRCTDGANGFIWKTALKASTGDPVNPVLLAEDSGLRQSNSTTGYALTPNPPVSSTSGFLFLELEFHYNPEFNKTVWIHGIKVRLGHK